MAGSNNNGSTLEEYESMQNNNTDSNTDNNTDSNTNTEETKSVYESLCETDEKTATGTPLQGYNLSVSDLNAGKIYKDKLAYYSDVNEDFAVDFLELDRNAQFNKFYNLVINNAKLYKDFWFNCGKPSVSTTTSTDSNSNTTETTTTLSIGEIESFTSQVKTWIPENLFKLEITDSQTQTPTEVTKITSDLFGSKYVSDLVLDKTTGFLPLSMKTHPDGSLLATIDAIINIQSGVKKKKQDKNNAATFLSVDKNGTSAGSKNIDELETAWNNLSVQDKKTSVIGMLSQIGSGVDYQATNMATDAKKSKLLSNSVLDTVQGNMTDTANVTDLSSSSTNSINNFTLDIVLTNNAYSAALKAYAKGLQEQLCVIAMGDSDADAATKIKNYAGLEAVYELLNYKSIFCRTHWLYIKWKDVISSDGKTSKLFDNYCTTLKKVRLKNAYNNLTKDENTKTDDLHTFVYNNVSRWVGKVTVNTILNYEETIYNGILTSPTNTQVENIKKMFDKEQAGSLYKTALSGAYDSESPSKIDLDGTCLNSIFLKCYVYVYAYKWLNAVANEIDTYAQKLKALFEAVSLTKEARKALNEEFKEHRDEELKALKEAQKDMELSEEEKQNAKDELDETIESIKPLLDMLNEMIMAIVQPQIDILIQKVNDIMNKATAAIRNAASAASEAMNSAVLDKVNNVADIGNGFCDRYGITSAVQNQSLDVAGSFAAGMATNAFDKSVIQVGQQKIADSTNSNIEAAGDNKSKVAAAEGVGNAKSMALGAGGAITNGAINAGTAAAGGAAQNTKVFKTVADCGAIGQNVFNAGVGALNNSAAMALQAMDAAALVPQIAANAVQDITTKSIPIVTGFALWCATFPVCMGMFYAKRLAYWTKEYVKPMSYWLKIIMEDPEETADKEKEEKEKKEKETADNQTQSGTSKALEKVNGVIAEVEDKMNMISAYISAGPKWLDQQVEQLENEALDKLTYIIQQAKDKMSAGIAPKIELTAKKQGQRLAVKINYQMQKQALKAAQKIKKMKLKAMAMAEAAKQKAMLKIRSMLGG